MTQAAHTTPLTTGDRERFHQLAPDVVKNRTPGYFLGVLDSSVHFFLAGIIPIVGVAWLGWSATNWLVLLVAGCWMGIVCDSLRLSFLNRQIQSYCDRVVDDTFVSVVAEAVRANKDEVVAGQIPSTPNYRVGVFVDLIFCTVSTFVIMASLPEDLNSEVFDKPWFLPSLIGFLAYRLLMAVWEIVDHRRNPQSRPVVKLALGLRGASMFVVMFIVLICCDEATDSRAATRLAVYGVNGALILISLLNLYGLLLMIRETRWLRNYLRLQVGNESE